MRYVNLVIDNKNDLTDNFYTYEDLQEKAEVGQKVYVPFGKGNKLKEAYVFQVMEHGLSIEDHEIEYKAIASIDEDISLSEEIIETCKWMKKRYFCRYIDALELFLPAGNKPKRQSKKDPLGGYEADNQEIEKLTDEQTAALDQIYKSMEEKIHDRFLLHGVTGSGKTEVYMKSCQKVLEKGQGAIILVPEVSLTKQMIERFIGRFGKEKIAVMHSKMTPSERYRQWEKIRDGQCPIVIGARSAVFAPMENIGLIILDEEHDSAYKSDMTPKYDTVEVAVKRATMSSAVVIMGSATPSVTSLRRCEEGIYKKLYLGERYNKVQLPEVSVEDMRAELKCGNRSVFSRKLYDEIEKCLKEKEQIILFINKRGYSSFVSCRSCGYVAKCETCNLPMTYHKDKEALICHYCGRKHRVPDVCPKCQSKYFRHFGAGTEKVMEEVEKYFPNAATAKIDFDTSKIKGEIENTLDQFKNGQIDILVGTQLVAKGLDYKNVGLVGIVAADIALNLPDYRSSEKVFQMITQAAGRAGRGEKRGRVVVQTYEPDNFAVKMGANHNIEGFYNREIQIRKIMNYPPFGSFARINIMGDDRNNVDKTAKLWQEGIDHYLGRKTIISVKREQRSTEKNRFRQSILIKYENEKKNIFAGLAEKIKEKAKSERTGVTSIVDVNPSNTGRN